MVSAADYLRKVLLSPSMRRRGSPPANPEETLRAARQSRQPEAGGPATGPLLQAARRLPQDRHSDRGAEGARRHRRLRRQPRPGVALSAAKLGIKAIIVMPKTTPDIKIDAVRRQGGNVMLFGNSFDEAYGESRRLAELEGYTLIPPFDDVEVIAGGHHRQGAAGAGYPPHPRLRAGGWRRTGRRGGGLHQAAAAGCEGDRGGGGGLRLPQGRAGGR